MTTRIFPFVIIAAIFTFSACSGKKAPEGAARVENAGTSVAKVAIGLEVGQQAPELAFKSPEGKLLTLSSLSGQMVLIDFWASWCMPCRIENPNLVQVYNKYRDMNFKQGKGFTVYSVSLDTDPEAWANGIAKDGLVWKTHVSDLQGWNSAPALLYKVDAIPANFLIDGNGIIVAKNLRAEALGNMMESLRM